MIKTNISAYFNLKVRLMRRAALKKHFNHLWFSKSFIWVYIKKLNKFEKIWHKRIRNSKLVLLNWPTWGFCIVQNSILFLNALILTNTSSNKILFLCLLILMFWFSYLQSQIQLDYLFHSLFFYLENNKMPIYLEIRPLKINQKENKKYKQRKVQS